ncbi:class I SAM-dependent methyltransferase [Pseudoalteromonas maricaloris]|uniref:Ribosomal RNA large subunit methyltransferase I n=1 Tax=Pseudoalteromonas maricaloris TaxID=184924 RepID=A0A8I2GZI9_9GAMM|nr:MULTISPECIES: class I SAM-dependent methyltransferase [Pseudoalteromonas]KID37980.1 23S rRNA methyltransferase [Pseudoalteromonas flavipulchra NCIMB 2033 = ATCC BAA-314]MBD0782853.1 methyltransferase domain-containing protein [Pseudoalteromonas flavipulchra]MBE0372449.1 23S rRNA (cytosine1962-C5)-methyltransferase [Pseudoalteromonas flavipulchra NCIMB 2033 = ATCC BAA-314]NLR20426.1 methyltransferase domain-containing protein [Pseudoalteromonas maricaloris]WOX30085.1 class I SAM-dependent me
MTCALYLQPGREKSLNRKHPWVFSKAIKKVKGKPALGDTVKIYNNEGKYLATAAYSPDSQIRARIWTFDESQHIDQAFFEQKLARALAAREYVIAEGGLTGFRLCAAESDGLPGVTIDKFDNYLVCQLLSAGAERHKGEIVMALQSLFPDCHVYERSDVDVRKKEGLDKITGPLAGDAPIAPVLISENGLKIEVDIIGGHKTGFYLDQRDSRAALERFVKDKEVLNCFCYTGTFGLYALRGGCSKVINVDVSQPALDTAKRNVEHNELDLSKAEFVKQDVFKLLRQYRDEGRQFDTIVMDPPKFAESKAQLNGACRGYKDINMIAMQILKPGGTLLTFSCSGLMEQNLFQKVVADAALDAGKELLIMERLNQAADHPIAGNYPEGFYLKGLICKVY